MAEQPPSTAIAISRGTSPVKIRSLDDLDDEDAILIARAFSQTSMPLVFSILGLGVVVMLGAVTLGMTSAVAIGAAGSLLAGGVGVGGLRRSMDVLQVELGVGREDAKRLYLATGTWGTQRWRRPTTDAELRDLGREIIARARQIRRS